MPARTRLLTICLFTIFSVYASAQAPTTAASASDALPSPPHLIRFSGTVTVQDASTVGITFALYKDQSGGAPLWQEVQNVTLDVDGHYSVLLGANTKDGVPVELFTANEARWLGVQVEQRAEQSRVLLVSVPYALKAGDAETLGGKPASAFVLAASPAGGSSSAIAKGATGNTATIAPSPTIAIGNAGFLPVFLNATDMGDSAVFQSGSSIGINTTSPLAAFHSVGSSAPGAYFDVYSNALTALPVVYRAARGTPSSPSAVQTDDILGGLAVRGYGATGFSTGRGQVMYRAAENWTDTAQGTYLSLTTTPNGTANWVERMRIDNAGNVGIGTSTPDFPLTVNRTRGFTSVRFGPTGSIFTINGPQALGFNIFVDSGGVIKYSESNVGGMLSYNAFAPGGFVFSTAPTGTAGATPTLSHRLTITSAGNVGIGTASPDNMLTVNGSADKPGGGSWGTYSDARLKTVGDNFQPGLAEVLNLNPVYYRYKENNALGIADREQHVGFVAQEVEKILPQAVNKNDQGYLLVNNDPILWAMLNAIKQQQALLQKQAEEIKAQREQITELMSQTRSIQAAFTNDSAKLLQQSQGTPSGQR